MESKENAIVPTLEDDSIKSRIFTIRGVQVMLDRDLAELYGVPTKRLNEQVKRNSIRFPANFMFPLSDTEIPDVFIHGTDMPNRSRSQIATSNIQSGTIAFPHETYGSSLRSQIVTLNKKQGLRSLAEKVSRSSHLLSVPRSCP